MRFVWILVAGLAALTFSSPARSAPSSAEARPAVDLTRWRGAISMPVAGLPYGPRPGAPDNTLFTAQGYDSVFDAETRARARAAFRAEGYTHWPYGPLLQKGYHGWWPDTDFRENPDQFISRARELTAAGIVPVLFLLDDQCVFACEHGGVKRDAIARELTPIYARPEWQETFPIVVAAWEPQWKAADWQWVAKWMADTWPNARRYVHLPSNANAPGRQEEVGDGRAYRNSAALWNPIVPYIHGVLVQNTWIFTGEHVEAGRTREDQFVYDLLDKVRRFRYGSGAAAPKSGLEVDRWNKTRGTDAKPYWQWDGAYATRGAAGQPIDVVAFEYASYVVKRHPDRYAEAKRWGALALTVDGVRGFGDGGPSR
ncbi:MAG TPA: hypothetical protein VFO19_17900 [Vicinamibacterales bacterium]|nr:hypothetical protein [Vicinamibacterales bacterium]